MTAAVKPTPGPARVAQVEGILKAEPVFADKLGPKDVEIQRRDGGKLYFHRLSYNTTLAIIESGKEPLQVPKTQVYDAAKLVLEGGQTKLVTTPAPVAAAPAPVEPPAEPAAQPPPVEKKKSKKEVAVAQPVTVAVEPAPAAEPGTQPSVNVALAVYSLVVMAAELAERDQRPGADERRALLKKVTNAYYTILPY